MALLIDIGTGIVGKLVELTFAPIGRQVGYLICYNRNVKQLEDQLYDLDATSRRMEQRVVEEQRNAREIDDPVKKWREEVEKITEQAKEILNEQHKVKKWLCGFCPNFMVRHQLSRRSIKLVSDVEKLGKKEFPTIAHASILQDVPTKDYEVFESRTLLVDKIMNVFRSSPTSNKIGVYGLGGVGKTTLIKEVAAQANGDKTLFKDVILILDVKQNPSIQRVQKEIAEKLGLDLPESESDSGRVRRLYNRIKDQKTLVILDDVWERIDLEAVGLSGVDACKVLLTSRFRDVLFEKMDTQIAFAIDVLGEEETWSLFEKKAGDVVKDAAIKAVAKEVAKRCGGLPVLVVTVASALRNKSTVHAWKDALRRLKRIDKEEEFIEKTHMALEWSYSQLNDEKLKQFFLFCGLFTSSLKEIYILDLFKYGIGLGLFENLKTMGEAWDAVNTMVEKLKDSCLLLDHEFSGWVKMHDLVHDASRRISSRDQHVLKISGGDELKEWPDSKDFCEKCTMISLRTSNIPKLPDILPCKELKLFHLDTEVEDYCLDIPVDFFKETTQLGVLDLSSLSIQSLPSSLQLLKHLKTLCLDRCTLGDIALIGQLQNLEVLSFLKSKIKELPKEIGQLTHLRSLDLTNCSQLELISPGVISSLERLEELRMGDSFNRWEAEGVICTKKRNASLLDLKHLFKLTTLDIHIVDANILPPDLFSRALERYQIYIGAEWDWDGADENLNTLKIKLTTSDKLYQSGVNLLLKRTDELHLNGTDAGNNTAYQLDGEAFQQLKHLHVHNAEFRRIINGKGVFPNLKRLAVSGLDVKRFLLSSSMAINLVQLVHLEVSGCPTMEGIISANESDEKHMKDMFSKLQHLELTDLPILTSFCSRSYSGFPSLEILELVNDKEIEEKESRENVPSTLFDEKILFPSLKRLLVNGLTKLVSIWHNQFLQESFKNLERLEINSCESLKSVFPSSMVRSLEHLVHLEVAGCGVEEIVANEDGIQRILEFVFSKLNIVKFMDLPKLRCICPSMHASWWPSLEVLWVQRCGNMTFLAQECSSFEINHESTIHALTNQALFRIKKESFPTLKKVVINGMEIWDGPFPVKFFSKLEHFDVSNQNSNLTLLEKSSVLQKLGETSYGPFPGKSSSGDIDAVGSLPHLSQLWLTGMSKLMHLGEDNSQIAGLNFPNLKFLGIDSCESLKNLRSSAISFENLTHLQVDGCSGLEYLITHSTAKSFKQLKLLAVENCARLVEIVRSTTDNDDSGNEIVFSQLEYLQLSNLPKLRGFGSVDCTVKFMSLETLIISKRIKLKIFHNDETMKITTEEEDTDVDDDDVETVTNEELDIDVDSNDGETVINEELDTNVDSNDDETVTNEELDTDVDSNDGETAAQVTEGNVEIDAIVGAQIDEITDIKNKKDDENYDESEHVQPLETIVTDQGVIAPAPVEENLAIVPVGEVTTPVIPVIETPSVAEAPHIEEVGEQASSGQNPEPPAESARAYVHHTPNAPVEQQSDTLKPSIAGLKDPPLIFPALTAPTRLNVHQTPNAPEQYVEEQSDPFEHSATATETLKLITPALPSSSPLKSSGAKGSLREKLQALSAKKAANSSGLPEEAKTKLKALIATADLKEPHTRQQLLGLLLSLQLSTTKWIADLAVQDLSKLQLVLEKEESLCQELVSLIAQDSELDVRSHILLSEGNLAEEYIQKVQEHKVELLALEKQIKKLEARATSVRDEITLLEKRYSGFEASLDQLVEEHQLNQLSVDSTSKELLRTRAESDSLCAAIFTYLRQLL